MKQSKQAGKQQNSASNSSSRLVSAVRWPPLFDLLAAWPAGALACLALLGCLLLAVQPALPQRPVLRSVRRDSLAGSLVLIPQQARLHSFTLPRQLAPLADHEVRTPPVSALDDPDQLSRWAEEFDFALTDGVVLSLDALLGQRQLDKALTAQPPLNFLKTLRARRPQLPLYAFVSTQRATAALELIELGELDFLLINVERDTPTELSEQVARRRLQDRVAFNSASESAALLLQARLLNRRFGFSPKVLTILASQPAQQQTLQQSIRSQLTMIDAAEAPASTGQSVSPDLLLFVLPPGTAPPQLSNFVNALEKAVEEGFRCALLDLSHEQTLQESLLNLLRQRKLLDRLASYAAAEAAGNEAANQALSRALAQANAWLISIKFLRDDIERLRRTERTQVGLLLSSYLRDWAYQQYVRPRLAAYLRDELKQTAEQLDDLEQAESFALGELRPYAERLFAEQFRRNVHAILLAAEERAEFEVSLLQGVRLRLTPNALTEPEIRVFVHLAHLGNFLPPVAPPRATWDFTNGRGLDERLNRRFEAVNWGAFKSDAEAVELSIRINPSQQANAEGYALRSRRSGQTRRIEINATTAQGAFYALARLEHLGADGQLAQDFNLTEAPSFTQRGLVERFAETAWSHRERLETLRFLGRVRLNRYVYASEFDPLRRERWREPYPSSELTRFRELAQTAQDNFVTAAYALTPGAALRYASDEDFAALTAKLKAFPSSSWPLMMLLRNCKMPVTARAFPRWPQRKPFCCVVLRNG
jgi:hypothetical protein